MKICYIANARIPSKQAHGIQIMKMCEAFAKLGHKVTLVVPNRRTLISDPFEYYGVQPVFEIKKLSTIDTVSFGKIGFWFHQFVFMLAVFFYAPHKKFDLVYSRDDLSIFMLSFLTKRLAWESHMGRHNPVVARILRSGIKIVVITRTLKEFYLSRGVTDDRILVAHDAVDLEEFNVNASKSLARNSLGLPVDKKIAMYIGAVKEWKGYETLLDAADFLGEDWQIVVIGGSEKKNTLLREKYPRAIFPGNKPYKDLPVNQRAADVLVIPNIVTQDPFELHTSPLKVFAHMASGVSIISSNATPLLEVLSEKNAVIFKAGDARDLAEKILWAEDHKEEAKQRADQALVDIQMYSWQERASNIIKHINF